MKQRPLENAQKTHKNSPSDTDADALFTRSITETTKVEVEKEKEVKKNKNHNKKNYVKWKLKANKVCRKVIAIDYLSSKWLRVSLANI
ncbi:CLUMA_CG005280, isoform A [Clunio marinus]|uniref:CLUMA_CG005280, isoform A n=1 Tax=Clunio marinus TaxID=568069 RepID=A0A1J1HW97_9DIPT|nr:CLUMA_CG005280, isoform A [Clunio marinus]